MAKMIKVNEDEWNQAKREVAKVSDLERRLKESEESVRGLMSRMNGIFPISTIPLEENAIARIQEELGVPRMVQEAKETLRSVIQEKVRRFLEDEIRGSNWQEMLANIRDGIDTGEVEQKLAELLCDWAKKEINIKELAVEIAGQLIQNGDIDLDTVQDNLVDALQDGLTVTCKFEKQA